VRFLKMIDVLVNAAKRLQVKRIWKRAANYIGVFF